MVLAEMAQQNHRLLVSRQPVGCQKWQQFNNTWAPAPAFCCCKVEGVRGKFLMNVLIQERVLDKNPRRRSDCGWAQGRRQGGGSDAKLISNSIY